MVATLTTKEHYCGRKNGMEYFSRTYSVESLFSLAHHLVNDLIINSIILNVIPQPALQTATQPNEDITVHITQTIKR